VIYVDTETSAPDLQWVKRADRLTQQLMDAENQEQRSEIIDANRALWGEIKAWLLNLSHGKCWYSEAKELCSFYDVDHFRPKKRAKNLDESMRGGYWWLAFDWRNYRISGNVCNRPNKDDADETRGKGEYFPLRTGSPVAQRPEDDIRDEIIYLLDPADSDDPLLISFNEEGLPSPATTDDWSRERVLVTTRLMHLDYPPLVEERKKIWTRCRLLISRAQALMQEQGNKVSVSLKNELKHLFQDLRKLLSSESELAGTARACLLQSGYEWAQKLANTAN
jgi:hypothetical protein